jgi:hypothetical protein
MGFRRADCRLSAGNHPADAILGAIGIASGWQFALAILLAPMIILFVVGLSKASY